MARPKKNSPAKAVAAAAEAAKETVAAKIVPNAPTKAKVSTRLQLGASEWDISDCKERVMQALAADGHKASAIKSLTVYLKPEEGKAYFVANDSITGSIAL